MRETDSLSIYTTRQVAEHISRLAAAFGTLASLQDPASGGPDRTRLLAETLDEIADNLALVATALRRAAD